MKVSAELRRAAAGVFFKLVSAPLERACRLVVILVAAPTLGADGFGTYQYASTVTAMLAAGTELGLGMWTTRTIARDVPRARDTTATGLWIRLVAASPYVVLLGGFAAAETGGEPRTALLLFGTAALANALVDYFGAILRGHERFRQEAVMNAVRALATAACAVASLRVFGTVKALGVGMLVGSFVSAAWGLFVLPDRAARRPLPDVLRAVVTEAVPLWLSGLLAMLYFRSDIVIVRAFSGEAEVGAYAAAYRIFEATLIVPASVMAVVFPRLVRTSGGGRTTRLEVAVTAGLLLVGVVVAAVLLVADDRIVALLLGKTFDRSAPSLRVLAFTVPVMFASFALCTFVIARGRERPFAWALAAMLLLNVGLNLRLVRSLDGVGAAWSTLFTELALVALCLFILTVGRSSSKSR